MDDKETDIRHRAHEIWESEGRPEGEHERHWRQAEQELNKKSRRVSAKKKDTTGSIALTSPLEQGGTKAGGPAGTRADSIRNKKSH
jgi:hypothetical protein